MQLLRKKPKLRMGVREDRERELRHPPHTKWVRSHACSVPGCEERQIEAAHFDGPIPNEDRGGRGVRDHDKWTFPLCKWVHHAEYHRIGWARFDAKYKLSTKAIAEECARRSHHKHRWERR